MKHINKRAEPAAFADWKAQASEDWQPSYQDLGGAVKQAVKQSLMAEQGHLCCYCEQRLMDSDSHIEHWVPQSAPEGAPLALDYGNLLCSCLRETAKGDPLHCGMAKGGWYEPGLMVSPLHPACEEKFAYREDGRILPQDQDDRAAKETIHRLNLDAPKLTALRAGAMAPFQDVGLSPEDLQELVAHYLRPDDDGRFGAFHTSIRYLFG